MGAHYGCVGRGEASPGDGCDAWMHARWTGSRPQPGSGVRRMPRIAWWHRVQSALTERLATRQASDCQPATAQVSMHLDRFHRVHRAAWVEAAVLAEQGADEALVGAQHEDDGRSHENCLAGGLVQGHVLAACWGLGYNTRPLLLNARLPEGLHCGNESESIGSTGWQDRSAWQGAYRYAREEGCDQGGAHESVGQAGRGKKSCGEEGCGEEGRACEEGRCVGERCRQQGCCRKESRPGEKSRRREEIHRGEKNRCGEEIRRGEKSNRGRARRCDQACCRITGTPGQAQGRRTSEVREGVNGQGNIGQGAGSEKFTLTPRERSGRRRAIRGHIEENSLKGREAGRQDRKPSRGGIVCKEEDESRYTLCRSQGPEDPGGGPRHCC